MIDSPPDRLDNTGSLCYKQATKKLAGWRLKHKLIENTDSQCELTSLAQKLVVNLNPLLFHFIIRFPEGATAGIKLNCIKQFPPLVLELINNIPHNLFYNTQYNMVYQFLFLQQYLHWLQGHNLQEYYN